MAARRAVSPNPNPRWASHALRVCVALSLLAHALLLQRLLAGAGSWIGPRALWSTRQPGAPWSETVLHGRLTLADAPPSLAPAASLAAAMPAATGPVAGSLVLAPAKPPVAVASAVPAQTAQTAQRVGPASRAQDPAPTSGKRVDSVQSTESAVQTQGTPDALLRVGKEPVLLSEPFDQVEMDAGVQPVGYVVIRIAINAQGGVDDCEVLESTVVTRIEQQLVQKVLQSKWAPAEWQGAPIAYRLSIRIDLAG